MRLRIGTTIHRIAICVPGGSAVARCGANVSHSAIGGEAVAWTDVESTCQPCDEAEVRPAIRELDPAALEARS